MKEIEILMIGVSTEQNTTNVIPAIQLQVNSFVFIETSSATKKSWSLGSNNVLKRHQVNILEPVLLQSNEDSRIDLIRIKIAEFIKKDSGFEIIWNLGGGQKAQQMALWQLFTDRSRSGFNDRACYTNPVSEELEIWEYQNDSLVYDSKKVSSKLNAIEILEIFGFITEGSEININDFFANKEHFNLWSSKCFREYFYRVSAIKDLMGKSIIEKRQLNEYLRINNQLINNLIKNEIELIFNQSQIKNKNFLINNFSPSLSKKIREKLSEIFTRESEEKLYFENYSDEFGDICSSKGIKLPLEFSYDVFKKLAGENKPASFFEKLLFNYIKLNYKPEIFTDCLFNVKTIEINNGKPAAEYDVLLATKAGKLNSLDAKTFHFEQKDADAREFNLSKAGGKYIEFIPVLPYDSSDFNESFYPVAIKNLMNRLIRNKTKFYVLALNTQNLSEYPIELNNETQIVKSINNF